MNQTAQPPPNPSFILHNSKPVNVVLFSKSNANHIYVGNREGDFAVYELESRRLLFTKNACDQAVLGICELRDGSVLTQYRNGFIYKWILDQSQNWSSKFVYKRENFTFCSMALSADEKLLFVPSKQVSDIDCIDLDLMTVSCSLQPSEDEKVNRGLLMNIRAIDTSHLIAGYENGALALFDLNLNKEIDELKLFEAQPVMCMDYNHEINEGYAGSTETAVKTFRIDTSSDGTGRLKSIEGGAEIAITNPGLNSIRIRHSDRKVFACGGWDSRIRLFSVKKKRPLVVLDFHKEAINTIDFSPLSNKNLFACGSNDGLISFWNIF